MNKKDLISATSVVLKNNEDTEKLGTIKNVGIVLDAMVGVIQDAMISGEDKISITGFGALEVNERAERTGRNPKTGEEIKVPSCKTIKFKASKNLKDLVNGVK